MTTLPVSQRSRRRPVSRLAGRTSKLRPRAASTCLRDGRTVEIRPVTEADEDQLNDFYCRLSVISRRHRFFTEACNLRTFAHWAAIADGSGHVGIVASDSAGRIVGHAAYVRIGKGRAEIALEVADELQHRGLGTRLIIKLARDAERNGISRFVAQALTDNHDMRGVWAHGFDAAEHAVAGVIETEFPTASWRLAVQRFGDPAGDTEPIVGLATRTSSGCAS
jgi:GNAT superfamily N-acetyltransferase